MKTPINKWLAVLFTIILLACAGGLNSAFVLKDFGDLGGLIIDVLALFGILKVWQMTKRPKPTAPPRDK